MLRPPLIPSVVARAICRLLAEGGPSAIFRLVIAVAVDAVKGAVAGSLPHVGQEVRKSTTGLWVPAVADRDSAPPVPGVACVARIATPPEHGNPTAIGRSAGHTVRFDARHILLNRSGRADFRPRLFTAGVTAPAAVVAGDVIPHRSLVNSCHPPATASARLRLSVDAIVVAPAKARALRLIAQVRAPVDALATAANAQRRFQPVSSQEVRRLVTKQVFGRDLLAASAFTVHLCSVTQA